MNILPQPHILTAVERPSLSISSWWEYQRIERLVDTIMAWLEVFPTQSPRSYDENWFPITVDSSSESLGHERRLGAGMFPNF